jgi:hypothetical protein
MPRPDSEEKLQRILLEYFREHGICSVGEIVMLLTVNADRTLDEHISQVGRSILLSWVDRGWLDLLGDSFGKNDIPDLAALRAALVSGTVQQGAWTGAGGNTLLQFNVRGEIESAGGAA